MGASDMIRRLSCKILTGAGAIGASLFAATAAFAQAAGPIKAPTVEQMAGMVNKGDTAWMLVSSALVLMMSVPALALFYGGLVRTKNMLSVLMQVFMIVSIAALVWVGWGYTLAFTSANSIAPGLHRRLRQGVPLGRFGRDLCGDVLEQRLPARIRFRRLPDDLRLHHAGPHRRRFRRAGEVLAADAVHGAVADRGLFPDRPHGVVLGRTRLPRRHRGQDAAGALVSQDAGYLWGMGALDFAGGTVVHINAGIAGLVGCLMIGKRVGFGKEATPPHSMTMTMIGASLLWVGWFGFNAGSNLEANGVTAVAFINTFVATAAAAVSWSIVEQLHHGKPSMLGAATGAVAGLVAITPASGFAAPMTAIALGLLVSPVCYLFVSTVKNKLKYDDTLDVFGVHCIGGIVGALGTAIVADPALGGQGFFDYTVFPAVAGAYDMGGQFVIQIKAVLLTLAWSGIGSAILFFVVDKIFGLRPTEEAEREGLDLTEHGERAYNY